MANGLAHDYEVPEPPVTPVNSDDLGAVTHDLHDLDVEGRQADGFGPKPKGVTLLRWGALKKLHRNMGHAAPSTMKCMLRGWGVGKRIVEAVDALQCSICSQVKCHDCLGKSFYIHSTLFNENVFIDELGVQLSDGTSVLALMVLDAFYMVAKRPFLCRNSWEPFSFSLSFHKFNASYYLYCLLSLQLFATCRSAR